MELSQADSYFNTVSLDGWSGSAWVLDVAMCNFMSFDRFITDRSFGQKKRMAEIGGATGIPSQYEAVRTPDGKVYLVAALNRDIANDKVYGSTYLLQEAAFTAAVRRTTTVASTYGIATSKTVATVATVFCDLERMTAESSREFDGVRYSSHVIVVPPSTSVTTNDELEIAGEQYEIVEVNRVLGLKEVRAIKRGTA